MSERIESDLRQIVADREPDPGIRAEVLDAIEGASQGASPFDRRFPLALPAAAAALLVVLYLVSGPRRPGPSIATTGPVEEPPVATALSADGRFRVDLLRLEIAPASGDLRRAELSFQARLDRPEPDLFIAHGDPVKKVVVAGGADRTPPDYSFFDFGHFPGDFGARGIDLGPAPDRLDLLEISLVILRLRPETVTITVPAGEPVDRVVAPFHFRFAPEAESFSIGTGMTDRSLEGVPDRGRIHPSRGFFGTIRVTDAGGRDLESHGGGGSGGWEVRFYSRSDRAAIAYPVTVRMRDPRPVETIPAVFRFEDLALPPLAPGPLSEWGEESGGLRLRARRPLSLEQGERMPVAVEIDHQRGLPQVTPRVVTAEAPAFLVLRIAPAGGGEELLLRPDLVSAPPDPPSPDGLASQSSPLDGTPVPVLTAEFPLARLHEELPPGRYLARVSYECPGPEDRWPFHRGDRDLPVLWRGTVTSASFPLEILPETEHRHVLVLPKELEVAATGIGLVVRFPEANEKLEEVRPVIPNGWYTGIRFLREGGVSGVGLRPGDMLEGVGADPGPLDRTYRVEVFRTLDPPGHFWGMGRTVTVLERTLRVRATAEELKALRAPR